MAEEGNLLTEEAPVATETPWYSDEYKDVVAQKGWDEPNKALKSYVELERSLGTRVKLPSPESSADEIRAFYQKTGCPENPDGYEIQVPENIPVDDEMLSALRQSAYESGVSKQAFEGIVKTYFDKMSSAMDIGRQQGEEQLRQELGTKYDAEVSIARRFCETRSEEFRKFLDDSGLGNNPIIIKEFIDIGKKTMGDSLIRGSGEEEKTEYTPHYKDSPEMYKAGEDEESKKARAYFEARGHKY